MDYKISGRFIEACDCKVMCPCWLDDDPDEGHCTGLVAWSLGNGSSERSTIDGVDVTRRAVVSVSTHGGNRRAGGATTVLFVDEGADNDQFALLTAAFSGQLEGPLGNLAAVSRAVVGRERAAIDIQPADDLWQVTVSVSAAAEASMASLVSAAGAPLVFEDEDHPLTLQHTALSHELGVPPATDVTAQRGAGLKVNLPALPAGYLDVVGRSGMSGPFSYRYSGG